MKSFFSIIVVLATLMVIIVADTSAQSVGDYRTTGAGLTGAAWSAASTWQRWTGTTWVAASTPPTGAIVITILSADSVFIDAAVSVTGTLRNQGKVGGASSLTIASGGTYQHDQNNGSLPVCTWAAGSTCKVTGYVSGSKPNNANQNFHHVTWSCAGQTANVDLGMSGNTIGGDFTVDTTGTGRVYLTSPAGYVYGNPITINGNIVVRGGQFSTNGSGSADTIEVTVRGNIIATGGNFSVSRGSGPDVTMTLLGNFSATNATLQNSGGTTKVNKLSFAGTGTQTVSLTNATFNVFTMEVKGGSTMNLGTGVIRGNGSFLLLPRGTLETGNPGGVDSAIQCTGTSNGGGNSLSTAANYTFNGTGSQVTGLLMPTIVDTLVINNAGGVTLSQPTRINGRLRLRGGVFNNTIPFTLGPGATISFEGGSLLINSVKSPDRLGIPESFFLEQNYPNPFNPSTTVRFGLPNASAVSAKVFNLLGQEVAALFDGRLEAGVHTLTIDAAKLGSGVYFYRVQAGPNSRTLKMTVVK